MPGIAMHGGPFFKKNFTHFPYVNPDANKGGTINFGAVGTFDGLNPFVIKNFRTTARGLFADSLFGHLVFEPMMIRSLDEAFTLYPLLAQSFDLNEERTKITFFLNPLAQFSDGTPVTPEDVVFTYELLRKKGRPPFSTMLKQVALVKQIGTNALVFELTAADNRELALLIASSMPILPKHAIDPDQFERNGLDKIPGTGPYVIDKVESGQMILYRQNPNYWGRNLTIHRGLNNFSAIKIVYFRNDNAAFEAFKKGNIDIFLETSPNRWRLGYFFPAVSNGTIIKDSIPKKTPAAMIGFVFNSRRPLFSNRHVRHALSMVFDFEWVNRNLYHGIYQRLEGFWDGSVLSAIGHPASEQERKLLMPLLKRWPDSIAPDVMNGTWHPLKTDGSGINRKQLDRAWHLLQQHGFFRNNQTMFCPDGTVFQFEIMTQTLEEEKLALTYQRFLAHLGIKVTVRNVDDAQYQNRLSQFDYDMIIGKLPSSISPGNEQIQRWASISRDRKGSFNYAGAAHPVIDALIDALIAANNQEAFQNAVRALDRVLISQYYYVPLFYLPDQWIARRSDLQHPPYSPLHGIRLSSWWYD